MRGEKTIVIPTRPRNIYTRRIRNLQVFRSREITVHTATKSICFLLILNAAIIPHSNRI